METDQNDKRLDRLFAAGRGAELYDPQKEYGFESRVMAEIRAKSEGRTPFLVWAWRLIPVFISLVIFLGIWTYMSECRYTTDLSVVTRIGSEEAMLTASLTGQ
ncbi:MAG: hypothetical protein ABSA46_12280 [Thermodesulfovibrionales bacterium]